MQRKRAAAAAAGRQAGRQDVQQGEEVHSWYCVRQTKTELMTVIFILLLFCVFLF